VKVLVLQKLVGYRRVSQMTPRHIPSLFISTSLFSTIFSLGRQQFAS
jgi:hypothetical protein